MENPLEGLFSGKELDVQCCGIEDFKGIIDRIEKDSIYFDEITFSNGKRVEHAHVHFMSHSYGVYSLSIGGIGLYQNNAVDGAFRFGEISSQREREEIREKGYFWEENIEHFDELHDVLLRKRELS